MPRSERKGWSEGFSFAVTLVTVAGVAIFLGWIMGQYAIQWVTSPTPRSFSNEDVARLQERLEQAPRQLGGPSSGPGQGAVSPPRAASSSGGAPSSSPAVPASSAPEQASAPAGSSAGGARTTAPAAGAAASAGAPASPGTARSSPEAPARASQGEAERRTEAQDQGTAPLYRVQVGAFSRLEGARATVEQLRKAGFEAFVVSGDLHRVQVGAFREEAGARELVKRLQEAGFEAVVIR